MRPIDDILRDVIEELEPLETLLVEDGRVYPSPRLWDWVLESEDHLGTWRQRYLVDTAVLIDAAQRQGCTIATMTENGKTWVEVKRDFLRDCLRYQTWEYDPREAVILALAKALGVETEE